MTTETASKAKLSPTAPIRSPAVQSRVAHPCKYPMCGVSFDNAKDLCDHVQSDHRGKSSKSVVPKSKFNSKRRRRRRDVSLNASDSDSQSASEMSGKKRNGTIFLFFLRYIRELFRFNARRRCGSRLRRAVGRRRRNENYVDRFKFISFGRGRPCSLHLRRYGRKRNDGSSTLKVFNF